jgi:hypothetical protein
LVDPALETPISGEAVALLTRWNRLHAVRAGIGVAAFALGSLFS